MCVLLSLRKSKRDIHTTGEECSVTPVHAGVCYGEIYRTMSVSHYPMVCIVAYVQKIGSHRGESFMFYVIR